MTETTLLVWPGGPHDFALEDASIVRDYEDLRMAGWVYICGYLPDKPYWPRNFLARQTDYGFELMPANRDPIAIWAATEGRRVR